MMTCVFILLGIVMYGIVIKVMPNNYRSVTLSNYTEEIKNLVSELESESLEEGINEIYNFCIDYSANAELKGNDTIYRFGEATNEEGTTQTISSGVTFIDSNENYILSLSVSEGTVKQIMVTFLKITPAILLLIFLISIISAQIISRVITKPVIDISYISKKLTKLDMTWRCNTSRTDEIGILANNLDTMAKRLNETLNELTVARQQSEHSLFSAPEAQRRLSVR